MSLLPEKATNLADAIRNLDHTHALKVKELKQYFVSRDDRIIKRIGRNLQYDYPQKFLFTGHRGTGKSTELASFEKEFADTFYVVRYSVEQVLDLFDITYVDVLLSIVLQLLKTAEDQKLRFNRKLLEKALAFGKEIEIEQEKTHTQSAEGSYGSDGVLGLLLDIGFRIGSERATRRAVREKVQYHISDLLKGIALLSESITKATGKQVVCVVEDLDKADIETARKIFYDYGKSIATPEIAIIYTFPAALQHSDDFTQITAYFGDSVTLPNFRVRDQEGEIADGMANLKKLLHARIVPELFSDDATECLIEMSGGIPRILLQLAKDAALEADIDDAEQVTLDHVRAALRRERRNFQRMLNREQLGRLKEIKAAKKIDQTSEYQVLLHNLSVLEYTDGVEAVDVWYDINPLVDELLS